MRILEDMKTVEKILLVVALLFAIVSVSTTPLHGTIWGVNDDGGQPFVNILTVYAFPLRFPLNCILGTLAEGLGCFPFDTGR